MQRRKGPPPITMIFLRAALEDAIPSFNKERVLVQQAHYTRRRGHDELEKFVVIIKQGSAMFFHMVWDQDFYEGAGDWRAINALACADLDELYQTASDQVKEILDDSRWDSV